MRLALFWSLSKGITLEGGHIATLQALGLQDVMVAQPDSDDIDENTAANTLAKTLVPDADGQGLRLTQPQNGRVNIMAHRAGVTMLDVDRINALNRIDPMITLATLPHLKRVGAGVMLATIKIISYAVAKKNLAKACDAVQALPMGHPDRFAMSIRAAVRTTATLIETQP